MEIDCVIEPSQTIRELAAKECVPCQSGAPRLKGAELKKHLLRLGHGWKAMEEHHLEKTFLFEDFRQALAFTNQVGDLAEAQNHHPDLYLAWGKVKVILWTHKIHGLSDSDFVLAAKIETLPQHSAPLLKAA